MLNLNEIEKARTRIDSYIHNSPVLTNRTLNKITEADLYFKCENFQKSGSSIGNSRVALSMTSSLRPMSWLKAMSSRSPSLLAVSWFVLLIHAPFP